MRTTQGARRHCRAHLLKSSHIRDGSHAKPCWRWRARTTLEIVGGIVPRTSQIAGLVMEKLKSKRLLPTSHAIRLGALVLAGALSSGCFSDPPPPPEIAPLEVIATTSIKPSQTCGLNRNELGAGTHDVTIISEVKSSVVRIRDSSGRVVFKGFADPQVYDEVVDEEEPKDLPEGYELPPGFGQYEDLRLEAGEYTVECEPQGDPVSAARLTVVPARPGWYEDYWGCAPGEVAEDCPSPATRP